MRRTKKRPPPTKSVMKAYTLWRTQTEKKFETAGERLRYYVTTRDEVENDNAVPCRGKGDTPLKKRIGEKEWELFRGLGDALAHANKTQQFKRMQKHRQEEEEAKAEACELELLQADMRQNMDGSWRSV